MLRKRDHLVELLLMLIMMISSVTMASCTNDEVTRYKEFVLSEGLASFSFEYPAFYEEPDVRRSLEPQSTEVETWGVIQPGLRGIEDLYISIFQVSDSFPNAKVMLDSELIHSKENHSDFRLLESSPVTIAQIQGERIIYSYYGYLSSMESEVETGTAFKVYFDSEGLIWRVVMIADEYAVAERAEDDFDHIIETFQILD